MRSDGTQLPLIPGVGAGKASHAAPFRERAARRPRVSAVPIRERRNVRRPYVAPTSRRWLRWLAAITASLGCLSTVAWAYASPTFRVAQIQVTGAQRVSGTAVAEASGLLDQSLFTLNREEALRAITANPLIKRASIATALPNAVTIQIEERQPWGLWQVGGSYYTVDGEGVVMGETKPSPTSPLVVDKSSPPLAVGDRVDAEAIGLVIQLREALPKALGTKGLAFEYVRDGGLVAVIDGGWRARFGDASDVERKIAIWKATLAEASKANLVPKHVDLRFGDRPFFR